MYSPKRKGSLKARYTKKDKTASEDNSLSENHPVIWYVKIVTGFKLALIPFAISAFVGAIIIYNSHFTWNDWQMQLILVAGGIAGILFAYWASTKSDLDDVAFRGQSSADIDELILQAKEKKEKESDKE